jgi:hypothetical protein
VRSENLELSIRRVNQDNLQGGRELEYSFSNTAKASSAQTPEPASFKALAMGFFFWSRKK